MKFLTKWVNWIILKFQRVFYHFSKFKIVFALWPKFGGVLLHFGQVYLYDFPYAFWQFFYKVKNAKLCKWIFGPLWLRLKLATFCLKVDFIMSLKTCSAQMVWPENN